MVKFAVTFFSKKVHFFAKIGCCPNLLDYTLRTMPRQA